MVVVAVDHRETVRDRFQARRFRNPADVRGDVRSVHDLRQEIERGVVQLVFQDDRLKAAPAVHVPQLHASHVVGNRAFPFGDAEHLRRRHVQELRVRVDEALHEPRARDPVDAGVLSGYPLHLHTPCS